MDVGDRDVDENMSAQLTKKLRMEANAPARDSSESCQVVASPRLFSCSMCSSEVGMVKSQSFRARCNCLRTTVGPILIKAPMRSQPTVVLYMATAKLALCDALRNSSSPMLNASFGLMLGTPSGHSHTAPSKAAHA